MLQAFISARVLVLSREPPHSLQNFTLSVFAFLSRIINRLSVGASWQHLPPSLLLIAISDMVNSRVQGRVANCGIISGSDSLFNPVVDFIRFAARAARLRKPLFGRRRSFA